MVKKRGLGKSLDALLIGSVTAPQDANDVSALVSVDSLSDLPIAQLQRGKYQPRRGMDSEALQDLANSIRAQGIIQPIVVREVAANKYEIIAGERRWRAAELAGLKTVPAIIRRIPDEAAVAIALIENIQRENLNPIEESFALQRLMDEFDMTHLEVAESVGKSRAAVTNLLRLLTLTDVVKDFLEQGDLEMGHARALLTLSPELQIEAAEAVIGKGLSVRQTEELARQLQVPNLTKEPGKAVDPDLARLQQDLTHKLRLKVAIQCNAKGKGKLVIQYNNHTELDQLLEIFQ
jgi:ParB family chromosome partitioning protein